MGFIAIKNTEHKGVYEEKGFNKDIYKTKGISHRRFKLEELDEALKWAGVKNVKSSEFVVSTEKAVSHDNRAYETIMAYKSRGFEGVCVTTNSFGEIILKINNSDIFMCGELRRFDRQKTSLEEHLKSELENAKIEKEKYLYRTPYPLNVKFEILRFENMSKVIPVNSDYLSLGNFWTRGKSTNSFEDKRLKISRTIALNGNSNDRWNPYNDFTISSNEILSIQPLEFSLPDNNSSIGSYMAGDYKYICRKMPATESKRIEEIFASAGAQNFIITRMK